jgi:prefoldin subunit 5
MTSDSQSWPLLEERAPFATASQRRRGRKLPRSVWLLTGLAFLCGGLVSAAAFSIGWRHQAQRNTAAQSELTAANARAQRLDRRIGALQTSLRKAHGAATSARASETAAGTAEKALARTGTRVGVDVTASTGAATSIASGAGSVTAAAGRVASELKTLDTYLTTTPTGQLDPGYIASQTAYLTQQLTHLQGNAGSLGSSVASFESTLRKLSRDAGALKAP